MINELERSESAHHEAGHVVVGFLVGFMPIKATVVGNEYISGSVQYAQDAFDELERLWPNAFAFADALYAHIISTVAGSVAESIYRISVGEGPGCDCDFHDAADLLGCFDFEDDPGGPYLSSAE